MRPISAGESGIGFDDVLPSIFSGFVPRLSCASSIALAFARLNLIPVVPFII
jgi:hypothetical protein